MPVECPATVKAKLIPLITGGLMALTVLAGGASPAAGQVVAPNGMIAYVACGPGTDPIFTEQCDIWIMNEDGSGQTNVTDTASLNEMNPTWSADGTMIAFVEGYNGVNYLKVVDLGVDGSGRAVTTITPEPSFQFSPTWAPSGSQIALVRQVPGVVMSIQFDIIVLQVDGSGESNITNSDFDELDPSWAPDGSRIAFAGVRFEQYPDPITGEPIQGAQYEIVTVNPDGSGEEVISAGDPGSLRATYLEDDRGPDWSPDSSKLVFFSQDQIPACCGPWQIWAVNRDGSGATNLTADPTVHDLGPDWSPDGAQIVFSRFNSTGGADLYSMPAPTVLPPASGTLAVTGPVTRLTTTRNASDPDWGREPSGSTGSHTLSVSVVAAGGRGGRVVSSPAGISCGRDCSEVYSDGTTVTLTSVQRRGWVFTGWSGACSGTSSTCVVSMVQDSSVVATFTKQG